MPEFVSPTSARVALVGAGTIATQYLSGLRQTPGFEPVRICSRDGSGARAFADKHGLEACSLQEILADPEINYVLNLTPASAHEQVTRRCLEAGKSIYSEKPLAATVEGADALITLAEQRGLLLACAPATFLWPPLATARQLLAEGRLGQIAGALTVLVYPGPELFHPAPMHLYGPESGPLRDMGVYQVTGLMSLLGPVVEVAAMASQSRSERTVKVGPHAGRSFPVHAPTHVHAQLAHASGAFSNLVVSFDAVSARAPALEVFGHDGGLVVENWHSPDASLLVSDRFDEREPVELVGRNWSPSAWAIGPTSAWLAYQAGSEVPTSARRARDVLEVLCAIDVAAASRQPVKLLPSANW